MWILFLNDIRSPKIEHLQAVCKAATKEELLAFIAKETVAPYQEPKDNHAGGRPGFWGKCFRQGGPLEWYNPPYEHHANEHYRHMKSLEETIADQLKMIEEQMRAQLAPQYEALVTNLPDVTSL